ncbi:MAG: CheR family methyltransferase [Candidatus Omnitrophota bacterium]
MAAHMGLYFPEERYPELERGIVSSARQFGFHEPNSFLHWLTSSPLTQEQIETLASYLTVGETYFFRQKRDFDVLEEHILPELIRSRRENCKRLRIWSAGCCTGEEPYSIAILLSRLIPDWREWNIDIMATDINTRFLKKAAQGRYGKWSFRNSLDSIQERFFEKKVDDAFEILPAIKKLAAFSYLNLAKDAYPSLANNTNARDIIFCRNVLMYFSPEQARKAVDKFYHSLIEGGWLIVSPCELSPVLFSSFLAVHFPDSILYRKVSQSARTAVFFPEKKEETTAETAFLGEWPNESDFEIDSIPNAADSSLKRIMEPERPAQQPASLEERGNWPKQEPRGEAESNERLPLDQGGAMENARLARTCANQGRLQEALEWCEKAVAANRVDAGLHYLRAMILQEQGNIEETIASLKRALYLDPQFALAYFALGNIARRQGNLSKSNKYFENAASLLSAYKLDDALPESDGITAGRLLEIVRSTIGMEG